MAPTGTPFPKSLKWALGFYFLCFLGAYFILQLKYRPAEVDDSWWLSFAYNFLHRHITYDVISGATVPWNGITHFGKTYAFLIGTILDFFGWTKTHAYDLSLCFVLGGFTAWYFILRRLQYSRELCATFCVAGLLLDPFFSAALSARTEAFVYLISSLALLLFVWDRYFESMVMAWISLETHPIGAVVFFLMAAVFWARQSRHIPPLPKFPRILTLSLGGFAVGALYYVVLYPANLSQLPSILVQGNQMGDHSTQNFLFDYFFHSKYHRHFIEFVLFLVCAFEFFRKKIFKNDPLVLPLTVSLLLFTFIFRRPMYHYALYFYPAFLLMLAKVFEVRWSLTLLTLGLLGLLLPQYAFVYRLHRDYDFNKEVKNYQKLIPADSLPVLGGYNGWFAFPGRDFYFRKYYGDLQKLGLTRFYLIDEDGPGENNIPEITDYLRSHFKPKRIGDFYMGKWHFIITSEESLSQQKS